MAAYFNAAALGVAVGGAVIYALKGKGTPSSSVADELSIVKQHWHAAEKTAGGRVDRKAFKAIMLSVHAGKLTEVSRPEFIKFLDRCFDAGTGLMLAPGKPEKADLGRHCFSYCALLAGEFYFSAASADPKTGACGCDAPVADVLGLKVD